jgi:pyrroline-5-carboxylate reductase
MEIGLIGCGNMARALARGWDRPVLCADPVPGRAADLAGLVGGSALESNAAVAARADLVVLCHKPAQLESVAGELAGARAVASILAGVTLAELREAYPDRPVYRFMPSLPVELREGAVVQAADDAQEQTLDAAVATLFGELGSLTVLPESQINTAMALMGCAPAYVALIAEAQIDAAVRHGIHADLAAELVIQTLAGTAELLRARGNDTLRVRREVSSPGGTTARGLAALESAGLRAAFSDAMDAALEG